MGYITVLVLSAVFGRVHLGLESVCRLIKSGGVEDPLGEKKGIQTLKYDSTKVRS